MDSKKCEQLARQLEQAMHHMRHTNMMQKDATDLNIAEKRLLWMISHIPHGRAKPSVIAKKVGVTLAAITHSINALDKQGYITRSRNPEDRRVVLLGLSPQGKKVIKKMKNDYWKKTCGLVEHLGESDTKQLINLISKTGEYFSTQ